MTRRIGVALLLTGIALAACSKAPDTVTAPVPAPTPRPSPLPPAPPGGDANTRLPAPELDATGVSRGTWQVRVSNGVPSASFAAGLFAIRCDPTLQQIVFARHTTTPVATIRIVTDTGAASYPAAIHGEDAIAATSVSDTFLTDVLAPATVRIGITTGGTTIVLPPDGAIVDVIAACRRTAGLVRAR